MNLRPKNLKADKNGINTMSDLSGGDISFLYEIPTIRDFKPIFQQGLQSQSGIIRIKKGDDGISRKL